MVTPRKLAWVKSIWASRPGGCSWGKYTSRSGPCSARQSCNRRCSVLSWDALNRPGYCSSSHSIIVIAFSLPLRSSRNRGSISSSQTPSKGSGRVRHQRSCFVYDGSGPSCHLRADRTHIPAMASAVSWVFPSIRFCLNSLTCRSLVNPAPRCRTTYTIPTGKNSQRQRHQGSPHRPAHDQDGSDAIFRTEPDFIPGHAAVVEILKVRIVKISENEVPSIFRKRSLGALIPSGPSNPWWTKPTWTSCATTCGSIPVGGRIVR